MARTGGRWAVTGDPHRHILPPGLQFSDPANDRKCLKTGPHVTRKSVKCDVEDCKHTFGHVCHRCKRVV
jgi:hypothetical protein